VEEEGAVGVLARRVAGVAVVVAKRLVEHAPAEVEAAVDVGAAVVAGVVAEEAVVVVVGAAGKSINRP
jgi:hypothetical protein